MLDNNNSPQRKQGFEVTTAVQTLTCAADSSLRNLIIRNRLVRLF